ncbi:lambda-crystallin-like [Ruditapes philippinarum]|uniref:lambda-crystallin-like n=1 Tax=Ruditapes philippinarum TaxID=129788 RepID=UPI00295A75D3|nr:lambda-crystallin-like [Ruditapes philippinarum]
MATKKEKVGIIGSGLIGRSFAMLFAAAEYEVWLYDIEKSQLSGALEDIKAQLKDLDSLQLLRGSLTAEEQFNNINTTDNIEQCVKDAIFVHECAPERIELKTSIYAKIDKMLSDTCILATSASALLPSKLAVNIQHKNRFIVAHPTNPPFYAPLVELVPSPWADPDVVPKTKAIMEKLGQVPVILKKEIDGFVLNRIQYAIFKESWRLIKDGIIDVEGLDKVMSAGLGRRYAFIGPIETAYLNADGMYSYADRYATMIEGIMATFREPDSFSGPVLDQIQSEMEQMVPMDSLQARRNWRDKRLAALAQLQKRMDDAEGKK